MAVRFIAVRVSALRRALRNLAIDVLTGPAGRVTGFVLEVASAAARQASERIAGRAA
jgi:hypothetical protein